MSEPPRELSAVERANRRREREDIRFLGWLALGIGMFCRSFGGVFLIAIPYHLSDGEGDAMIAAFFGVCAAVGCALGLARIISEDPIPHAGVAAMLNGLFLIVSIICTVLWL